MHGDKVVAIGSAVGSVVLCLVLSGVASALGGIVVVGVGSGTAYQSDGDVCDDATFEVTAHYFPANRGMLQFNWAEADPSLACSDFVVGNGGGISLGTVRYDVSGIPTVEWEFSCRGNEADGLDCSNGFVRIGPYLGPGSQVWLLKSSVTETFVGTFTAA